MDMEDGKERSAPEPIDGTTTFTIGQRVQCRDAGDWKEGRVTSIQPLEVHPDGYSRAFAWKEVRKQPQPPTDGDENVAGEPLFCTEDCTCSYCIDSDDSAAANDNKTSRKRTSGSNPNVRSNYHGVKSTRSGKWQAQIWAGGKVTHLGTFEDEEDAAREFDRRAIELGRPTNFGHPDLRTCSHGRRKLECDECGRASCSICPHGRVKRTCKECGGKDICPHGRRKSVCKECGGGQICPHGRLRSVCKECGGNQICPHGRLRPVCKKCGGNQICPHGRRKPVCKECGGSQICPHGRQKHSCRECGGSRFCSHGRQKRSCKECKGSLMCPHGRQKRSCEECTSGPDGKERCASNHERSIVHKQVYKKMCTGMHMYMVMCIDICISICVGCVHRHTCRHAGTAYV